MNDDPLKHTPAVELDRDNRTMSDVWDELERATYAAIDCSNARDQLIAEAAAAFDRLAERIEAYDRERNVRVHCAHIGEDALAAAAECRKMAKRLWGET